MSNDYPQPPQQDPNAQHGAQQPGTKYNTAAYQPAGQYGAPLQRPRALDTLRNLTLISAGLYLVSTIISVFTSLDEDLIAEQLRSTGMLTETQIEESIEFGLISGLVTVLATGLIALILYVVVIIGVSKAKNWARILGIVLAIIGLLFTVGGTLMGGIGAAFASPLMIASTVVLILWIVVSVLWLIKAFSAPVREYFAAPPQARA
ncbi:hypothetical protein [Citricoccus sp. NR2]|uniref:hypothetical protein n=1 Tax=Citricoccus sp. NR2 TaxID=3004095 RepID=UPI0022DE3F22|nr:hypothetical protein [Citricoccus sp. NR2]WBL19027.1 hypothetical protein O1A05_14990 [Citricoccus sp. NR2]